MEWLGLRADCALDGSKQNISGGVWAFGSGTFWIFLDGVKGNPKEKHTPFLQSVFFFLGVSLLDGVKGKPKGQPKTKKTPTHFRWGPSKKGLAPVWPLCWSQSIQKFPSWAHGPPQLKINEGCPGMTSGGRWRPPRNGRDSEREKVGGGKENQHAAASWTGVGSTLPPLRYQTAQALGNEQGGGFGELAPHAKLIPTSPPPKKHKFPGKTHTHLPPKWVFM